MFYSQIKFFLHFIVALLENIFSFLKDSWWWHDGRAFDNGKFFSSSSEPRTTTQPISGIKERIKKVLIKFINDENGNFHEEIYDDLAEAAAETTVSLSRQFHIKLELRRRKTLLCQSTARKLSSIETLWHEPEPTQLMLIINEHAIVIFSDARFEQRPKVNMIKWTSTLRF